MLLKKHRYWERKHTSCPLIILIRDKPEIVFWNFLLSAAAWETSLTLSRSTVHNFFIIIPFQSGSSMIVVSLFLLCSWCHQKTLLNFILVFGVDLPYEWLLVASAICYSRQKPIGTAWAQWWAHDSQAGLKQCVCHNIVLWSWHLRGEPLQKIKTELEWEVCCYLSTCQHHVVCLPPACLPAYLCLDKVKSDRFANIKARLLNADQPVAAPCRQQEWLTLVDWLYAASSWSIWFGGFRGAVRLMKGGWAGAHTKCIGTIPLFCPHSKLPAPSVSLFISWFLLASYGSALLPP